MTLAVGLRLGPYEILSVAGSGGMGEVYRAKDTRLDRTVAIKVLPTGSAHNADLRQRLEREAKAVSSLNHPHICILHDVGHQDGIDYLVMEYLEGETLAKRLEKGPLPTAEVLKYAVQMADALDKAHRQGLVHRDLKPGNIMLTKSGAKLLDFGLAKLAASGDVVQGVTGVTRTTPLTGAGTILGTLHYMPPEQLEGTEADARSDIFAFGCVLYEMATGRRAFEGKSQASLIAAIMGKDPAPISSISQVAPPALDRIVSRCLAKDPDDRWQTARDLCEELRWIGEGGGFSGVTPDEKRRSRLVPILAWTAAIGVVSAVLFAWLYFTRPSPPRQTMRFSVPPDSTYTRVDWLWISPDGTKLAFRARPKGQRNICLYVRPLNSQHSYAIQSTVGAITSFWSPDSKFLAFFSNDLAQLKKVPVTGGPAQLICDAEGGSLGTWGKHGDIVFNLGRDKVLHRVSMSGGVVTDATRLDTVASETEHSWPSFLPDGRHFVYLASLKGVAGNDPSKLKVMVGSLDDQKSVFLFMSDSRVEYDPAGFILYADDSTLMARRFDAGALELVGDPFPVAERVGGGRNVPFSVSNSGTLIYVNDFGVDRWRKRQLCWLDRKGQAIGSVGDTAAYRGVRLSHDEKRIAYVIEDPKLGTGDIWVRDLERKVSSRLTFDTTWETSPLWSSDDSRILLARQLADSTIWVTKSFDGMGAEVRIAAFKASDSLRFYPQSWSSDGELIACIGYNWKSGECDVYLFSPRSDSVPRPLLVGPYLASTPALSPDGRYLAVNMDETGGREVYVIALGQDARKWRISEQSGGTPLWSKDGKELFYTRAGDTALEVWSVPVTLAPTFEAGVPSKLFEEDIYTNNVVYGLWRYDVTADGQRFIVDRALLRFEKVEPSCQVVLNWSAELEDQ